MIPNRAILQANIARNLTKEFIMRLSLLAFSIVGLLMATGCSPTVRVEPSDKPITINLNVKIEHEIRVKVDKELDSVLSDDSGLF